MTSATDRFDAAGGSVVREAHAAVVQQLQHTVRRLQEALDNARRGFAHGEAIDRALRVLPAPVPRAGFPLSSREHEVLQCIVAGDSNKMIARALGLSPHTVKRHVANILGKIGVRSRAQAAAWLLARH